MAVTSTSPVFNHSLRFSGNRNRSYAILHAPQDTYGSNPYYAISKTFNPPNQYLHRVFESHLKPGDPILELGCHKGNNLVPLAKKGYRMYGLDLEGAVLSQARQNSIKAGVKKNVQLRQWDFAEAGDTPWPKMKGKFKAIYATNVMSHLSSEQFVKTMRQMQKQLAPDGIIICSVIDKDKKAWAGFRYYFQRLVLMLFSRNKAANWGFVQHSRETVSRAFEGLKPVEEFSRYFEKGEKGHWVLPERKLRWITYCKPKI